MKVIKHGDFYQQKEIKCKKCNALLSYCFDDIKTRSNVDEIFGEIHSSFRKYIICPDCNYQIDLSWFIDGIQTVNQ